MNPTPTQAQRRWSRASERGILPAAVDQVLTDRWNRFVVDPGAYLDEHHCLAYAEPQAHWANGCPLGNGDLGALAYGPPEATTFSFGKTDLWDDTPMTKPNFPAGSLDELREICAAQDNVRFRELQERTKEVTTRAVATAKPGGLLRLELFPSSLVSRFRQRLSFAHAEVEQTWHPIGERRRGGGPEQTVTLTAFVHAAKNVFACRVEPGRDLPWRNPVAVSLGRPVDADMPTPACQAEGSRLWVRQDLPRGAHFVLMAAVVGGGCETTVLGDRVHGSVRPTEGGLTVYVTLVTSLESDDPLAEARRNLDDAEAAGFATLRETHRAWWHGYWRRGCVCTPWPEVERAWYQALYQQACCCRPGRMSPGLQSNLIKENYPAWNADFHNNINMQILYWGQYTANRLELAEPFYRLFNDILPRCKQDTADYFGMRGARYPISMGPDGVETAPGILLSTWIGAGGWLAEHFWWHYQYSGDRDFLERYAYPLLKEAALFYEDYLQEDDDGELYLFPTIQMEIAIGSVTGAGRNSAWDLPVVIRTFQMALAAATELDDTVPFCTVEEQMKLVPIIDRIVVPGEVIALPTNKGQVYLISKEIPWFTNIPVETVCG
ncbi:MAG: glycoside hydrolase family 95 protein [Candidatus Marinimicrobia bacterium]|nr:glycoside hydrolase family 95 protein [Candidatus Neomarinimicrobiota bacterium]